MNELHLVLGGMRSGKSRFAQTLASQHEEVVCLVTALPADAEMRARIERHRADRPPQWQVVEVPPTADGLAAAVDAHARAQTCLLVDCLTVWLSQLICPPDGVDAADPDRATTLTLRALQSAPGHVIVVSNEIGLGVVPLDAGTRRVVDALGRLHQVLAAAATHVTWTVAGLPVRVKEPSR